MGQSRSQLRCGPMFRLSALGKWLPTAFLIALVAASLGGLVWLTFFTDTFTVQMVTVVDARPNTAEATVRMAQEFIGRSMFFLPLDALEQKLVAELPHIRTVHGVRKLPSTLKLIIQEKQPALLLLAAGKYYFVDEGGVAYEEASLDRLPGVVLPTLKTNDVEARVTLGTRVVEAPFIQFVAEVARQLPDITQAQVVEMRIPSLAAREVHFYLSNNWQIRFDSTRPVAGQLAVLRQLLNTTIPAEEKQVLEYIDLRIPNRVYYKTSGATAKP